MTESNTETNGSTLTWSSLNLNQVDMSSEGPRTEVPAGSYKFRLVGAKASPYQEGATDLDLVISEGPQQKRHVFASLPHPSKGKWVIQAASLLVKAIGGTQQPGEDLIDTLNRTTGNGANPITADIVDNFYTDKTTGEQKQGRPRVQFFSIQPSA